MAAPSKRWASQAKINALLRFSPQREALANLTREAKQQYASSIAGAESAGRLTSQAVQAAKPQVSGIYDRAQGTSSATRQQLAAALAALGPAASGFKAAAATEGAAGSEKTARERAAAEGGLEAQDVAAKEAPAFARTLANQQLATSLAKIFSSTQSVASGEGEATASELAKLEDQAEGRALTARGQNLSHQSAERGHDITERHDRESRGAGGVKLLSAQQQNSGLSTIEQIRHFALEGGSSRAERVATLSEGTPAQTVKNEKGEAEKEPGIPAFKADVLMSAALDLAEYGHLARGTAHRLSRAGYDLKRLGLPTYKSAAGEGVSKAGKKVSKAIEF